MRLVDGRDNRGPRCASQRLNRTKTTPRALATWPPGVWGAKTRFRVVAGGHASGWQDPEASTYRRQTARQSAFFAPSPGSVDGQISDLSSLVRVTEEGLGIGNTANDVMATYPGRTHLDIWNQVPPYSTVQFDPARPTQFGMSLVFGTTNGVVSALPSRYEFQTELCDGCL